MLSPLMGSALTWIVSSSKDIKKLTMPLFKKVVKSLPQFYGETCFLLDLVDSCLSCTCITLAIWDLRTQVSHLRENLQYIFSITVNCMCEVL